MKDVFGFAVQHPVRCMSLFAAIVLCAQPFSAHTFTLKARYLPCTPALSTLISAETPSAVPENFYQDIRAFSEETALRYGFDPQNLSCILEQVHYTPAVIRLVAPAPAGTIKNWQSYRARFLQPARIAKGVQFWQQYEDALNRAETVYGVPPEIIVGILGVETVYGKNKGRFRIMDTLATLAFNYPEHPRREDRVALFKKELEQMLLLCAEQEINPLAVKGSFAGAIGWPQFLPSSIRRYAVDFDGDGKIDLENSPVDAIGSIAHFLNRHGWKKNTPAVFPAVLNDEADISQLTGPGHPLAATISVRGLKKSGITSESPLPQHLLFGLIDLENGGNSTEYWLGTANFFAITHYNRSYFYAMAVIQLGEAVKAQVRKKS